MWCPGCRLNLQYIIVYRSLLISYPGKIPVRFNNKNEIVRHSVVFHNIYDLDKFKLSPIQFSFLCSCSSFSSSFLPQNWRPFQDWAVKFLSHLHLDFPLFLFTLQFSSHLSPEELIFCFLLCFRLAECCWCCHFVLGQTLLEYQKDIS